MQKTTAKGAYFQAKAETRRREIARIDNRLIPLEKELKQFPNAFYLRREVEQLRAERKRLSCETLRNLSHIPGRLV